MNRHVAAVAIVLCLSPSWLCAQSAEFTVNTLSADVYKGPSTGSPVIGKAPRGMVLEVTRELGDWVRVSWPAAPDSTGYIRLSVGSLVRPTTLDSRRSVGYTSTRSAIGVSTGFTSAGEQVGSRSSYVTPPPHLLGLGGHVSGATLGFGGTARGWSHDRLGIQLGVSRYALTSSEASGRVTSIQFAPSVLYSLRDRVSDYAWVRPYVGAGPSLSRSTQPGFGSTSKVGFQAFGGGEVSFPSVPRFALSADVGYRWSRSPYAGFELGGVGFSVSGHWYVK